MDLEETMDIYSKPGSKIIFRGKGGYDFEIKDAKKILNIDQIYTVSRTKVRSYSSTVELIEFLGHDFNTVMFKGE